MPAHRDLRAPTAALLLALAAALSGCASQAPAPGSRVRAGAAAAPGGGSAPSVPATSPPPAEAAPVEVPPAPSPEAEWAALLRSALQSPLARQVRVAPAGAATTIGGNATSAPAGSCALAPAPAPAATPAAMPSAMPLPAGGDRWVAATNGRLLVGDAGAVVRRLPDPGGTLAGVSADGAWAVLAAQGGPAPAVSGVFLVPLGGGTPLWLPGGGGTAWAPSGDRLLAVTATACAFVFDPRAGRTVAALANPAPRAGLWLLAKGWFGGDPVLADRAATHESPYLLWRPAAGTVEAIGPWDTGATVDPAHGILDDFPGPCVTAADPATGRATALPCVGDRPVAVYSAPPAFSPSLGWFTVPFLPPLPAGPASPGNRQAVTETWLEPASGTQGWVLSRTPVTAWSPGGHRLALLSLGAGSGAGSAGPAVVSVLSCSAAACTAPGTVARLPGPAGAPVQSLDWTPDGRTLVAAIGGSQGGVWTLPASGGPPAEALSLPLGSTAGLLRLQTVGVLASWQGPGGALQTAFLPDGAGAPASAPPG